MTIYSKTNPLRFYVYVYLRQVDNTPYYVGKGTGDRLFQSHRSHGITTPKDKTKIIILEANLTETGAFALERRMIRWYGRKDLPYSDRPPGVLHNKTDGGEGFEGIVRSLEWKRSHSQRLKGKPGITKGMVLGPQTPQHLANRMTKLTGISKRKRTPEENVLNSQRQVGIPKGPQRIIECPHCRKTGGATGMRKWHFNNCKAIDLIS